ncbi:MAG TPA: translation initiation factor IF-2 [Candidatus Krumholzibacteria bacterium]|nr:translation initiation factor IF-2 [Candidatus Krumholzibacteria bacterium]
MRISELAKKYNVTNDELVALLKNAGYQVASAGSAVDYDMLTALDRHFSRSGASAKKGKGKTTSKASKAAAAASADTAKAKVKLRKAKGPEPEPVVEAPAKEKPKVKLAKAAKPAAEPAPSVEPKAEAKAEVKEAKSAKKSSSVATAPAAAKTSKRAEAEAEKPALKVAPAPKAPPKPKKLTPLDELAKAAVEPLIAIEPDTPADEVEEWVQATEEHKRHGHVHAKTSDAEQVRESVRRTLAKMETTRKTKRRKTRAATVAPVDLPPVRVQEGATPADLGYALGVSADDVLSRMSQLDLQADASAALDRDTIELVAEELGRRVDVEASFGETQLKLDAQVDPTKLVARAPVVTVMGHVDHGKTSILDYIRKANVAAGEAGGITQHVGAYEVTTPNGKITFIDTPGHEAFTAMRARGAKSTDIVVLVVAADDGVMPQTIEAINHVRAAKVPMIVAMNKVDLPTANPAGLMQQLAQQSVLVEGYGGDVVSVEVSAKTGKNIDKLLEMILLQAELAELKADPTARAQGVVVEVRKEEGRGILITVLVQQGTLRIGDVFVVGNEYGKVRSLFDHAGRALREAGPSTPVVVLGADGMPEAGDQFIAVKNEREAREVAQKRQENLRAKGLEPTKALTLEELYAQIQGGAAKELNVVLKADTNGSLEALRDSLLPLNIEGIKINLVHGGVGGVSESDVLLAQSTNAVIIAFNTKVTPKAKDIAKLKGIEIRSYKIIYEAIEDVDKALKGMLEPVFVERVLGRAEVRKIFRVSKLGTIAGCMVVEGTIQRNASARVIRNGEVIAKGKIGSLKRFQDDAREVAQNFECGIGVSGFDDFTERDIIEAFVVEEKARVF